MEGDLEIPYIEKDIEGKNYAQRLGMLELGWIKFQKEFIMTTKFLNSVLKNM